MSEPTTPPTFETGTRARLTRHINPWASGKAVTVIETARREGIEQAYCRATYGDADQLAMWVPIEQLKPDWVWNGGEQ